MANTFRTGSFTGAGVAVNLSIGWIPDYVKTFNRTDGTTTHEWNSNMADGTSIATITTAGPVLNAADGMTPYAGSSSAGKGITLGTDICTNAKVIDWVAFRHVE
ncbi:hypothetical protein [Thalassobaculum sp.]|uniref:hypothetical protein n=1 Tax=Thalassobaculum sp. TaxID=2022740 RepID=UPI0032EEBDA0